MGITLPAGIDIIYNKTLRMYDISVLCNVGKNPQFFPRSKTYTLREITYLFNIAYAWGALTQGEKDNWALAGDVIGLHGYNLYVQEKSYRMKNGIGGIVQPSLYHQFMVGHISIPNSDNYCLIRQSNSHRIYFPATFELCYKTNLTSAGVGATARLYFSWTRYLSGQNIIETQIIEMPLSSAWTTEKISVITQGGLKGRWELNIELYNCYGDIWFDNVIVEYNGAWKNNDPLCDDVSKYWYQDFMPEGGILESIYPTGGAL